MLRQALGSLFAMELDHDPSITIDSHRSMMKLIWTQFSKDPQGRFRIIYVDTEDLSFGMSKKVDVTGRSIPYKKLILIGVPEKLETDPKDCRQPGTIEGYLLAITLHEMYELLTGDFGHCHSPGRCINSECNVYDMGTCSACLGALLDEKFPDLKLDEIYCPEHLAKLKIALKKWNGTNK
jgi:hypothetical protein